VWPPGDGVITEPTAFAYLAAGLLEEAAKVVGTERRDRVTVIVYGSVDEFHEVGGAPRYAAGMYDGAVKLPPAYGDFGVRTKTLRHELMHAQLHATVGCMPVWLNEGAAQQFAQEIPQGAWLRALRDKRVVPLAKLESSHVADFGTRDLDAIYAQSLAMLLMAEEPPTEDGLRGVLRALKERPHGPTLWTRMRPNVGAGELLDALSRRVFGLPTGRELESIFQGAVCCHGTTLSEFGCRGGPIVPGKRTWFDDRTKPSALCSVEHVVGTAD
jgi:hypothetical protein